MICRFEIGEGRFDVTPYSVEKVLKSDDVSVGKVEGFTVKSTTRCAVVRVCRYYRLENHYRVLLLEITLQDSHEIGTLRCNSAYHATLYVVFIFSSNTITTDQDISSLIVTTEKKEYSDRKVLLTARFEM